MRYFSRFVLGVVFSLSATVVWAGNLNDPGAPGSNASKMYTLEDIYQRLNDNTQASNPQTGSFTEPVSGPSSTGHTLNDLYPMAIPTQVPKTGQTTFYATGDDGDLKKGVSWPNPRFTKNSDGTVTDNMTGLIWLENANCSEFYSGDTTGGNLRSWSNALTAANSLADGYCGLSDSSSQGNWRLPNLKELQSLIDLAYYNPAICNTVGTGQWSENDPFSGLQQGFYWSSNTFSNDTDKAYYYRIQDGRVDWGVASLADKTYNRYVWPVRGGQ